MRISDWSSDVCSSDLIEAAKDIDSRVDQVGNFTFLAYVCAEETRFPAGLANGSHDLFASLFIATRHHDTSAFSCKANRTSATAARRSEEHTSELQSLMRTSYAVFCLKKKKTTITKYKI